MKNKNDPLIVNNKVFYITKPNQKSINTMKRGKKFATICICEVQITNCWLKTI